MLIGRLALNLHCASTLLNCTQSVNYFHTLVIVILSPDTRETQKELREAAVQRSQERAEEEQLQKAAKKQELGRFGVKQQMDVSVGGGRMFRRKYYFCWAA